MMQRSSRILLDLRGVGFHHHHHRCRRRSNPLVFFYPTDDASICIGISSSGIGDGLLWRRQLHRNLTASSSSSSFSSASSSLSSRRTIITTTPPAILYPTTDTIRRQQRRHRTSTTTTGGGGNNNNDNNNNNNIPTLFSLPNLRHPSDFIKLANNAIRECDAVRRTLATSLSSSSSSSSSDLVDSNNNTSTNLIIIDNSNSKVHKAKQTLHHLDDISNIVCTVIDAAELCRSVHASPQWRRGATDAFGRISEYIGNLNADAHLYHCLRRFVFDDDNDDDTSLTKQQQQHVQGGDDATSSILSQLSPEYQRMAIAMRREFERDGIHLSYNDREEARELNNIIVNLESLFTNNITEKTKYFNVVGNEMVNEVEKIIPRHVLGQLVRTTPPTTTTTTTKDGSTNNNNCFLTLSSDNLLCNTLLAHSPSSTLRKEIYYQANTSIPENLAVLDSLIRYRHLHSKLLGYTSYAHRVLTDRMVGSPKQVQEFLSGMQERSKHVFRKDMEMLRNAKAYVEGGNDGGGDIEPWDIPFYTTLIKAQRQQLRWKEEDVNDVDDESSQLSGYFTVENSIGGMIVLVKDLFGIDMKEVDIPFAERWDIDTTKVVESEIDAKTGEGNNNNGLRKFEFHHDEEGPLGTMFFDLHPRDGKFLHAAHFTIRCGRIREEDTINTTNGSSSSSSAHQLPIVALVCNLTPPPSSSSSTSLLSHSEVETLYHEFGHGLHSLLSRTSFQHLSGTRASMDFVETPSHLFESFARDPSFLSRILARHYITGVPLSDRKARHLALSYTDFRGLEIQTQIVHSKFDQALFGSTPCSPSLGGCSSTDMFQRLHEEAGVPYAHGTHWHTKFGHLVTYGAGYYGYLYAQTFAADIWMSVLAPCMASASSSSPRHHLGDAAVRNGGMKIWKEMLLHGGAKDPKEMLHAVLGREPSVDPFFKGMS